MSKSEIVYEKSRRTSPLSYWVHRGVNESDVPYGSCTEFIPPFPCKHAIKGFPYLRVKVVGFEFEFSSNHEVSHCIEILQQKNLPTTSSLSGVRGSGYGPNNHWLSRLPAKLKSWNKREKIIMALKQAKNNIKLSGIEF